ncbi:MAG: hypothetical protein N2747_09140 [Chitinophagaceae bacterium]|nr:hypothetical protein [Chitinophagaceae bacterium]
MATIFIIIFAFAQVFPAISEKNIFYEYFIAEGDTENTSQATEFKEQKKEFFILTNLNIYISSCLHLCFDNSGVLPPLPHLEKPTDPPDLV